MQTVLETAGGRSPPFTLTIRNESISEYKIFYILNLRLKVLDIGQDVSQH